MEDCDGPILTAPLCLNFHTLLSHYKRIGTNRSDTEDTGEKRRGEERGEEQRRGFPPKNLTSPTLRLMSCG